MPSPDNSNNAALEGRYLAFTISGLNGYNLKRGVFFNPDPYVKLRVLPGLNCRKLPHHKQRCLSKQVKGTTNPTWKEQFYVQVLPSDVLEFEVKDKFDRGRPVLRGFLGKLDVPVSEILERLQTSEQRYTGALAKRNPLDQTSGSLSFVFSDGRSGLYSPFPNFVNGHEHLQRMSIASSESSCNDLPSLNSDINNEVLSTALDAHLITKGPTGGTTSPPVPIREDSSGSPSSVESPINDAALNSERVLPVVEISSPPSTASENLEADSNATATEVVEELDGGQAVSSAESNQHSENCNDYDRIVEQTDDMLTITTTNCPGATDNGSESADVNGFVKETNLNEVVSDTAAIEPEQTTTAAADHPSTSHTTEQPSTHSQSLPVSSAIQIRNLHPSCMAVDSEGQTSPHSIPTNLAMPVLDKAITKTKRDKETLRRLLRFVAVTEEAKIKNKETFANDNLMLLDLTIHRPTASSHLGFNIVGGSESKHLILRKMGIYVTGVEPFSPADMTGIKVHDRLLSINNVPVVKVPHSVVVKALQSAGCDVEIKIERCKHAIGLENGRRSSLPLTPTPKDGPSGRSSLPLTPTPKDGLSVSTSLNTSAGSETMPLIRAGSETMPLVRGRRLADSAKRRHRLTSRDSSEGSDAPSQEGLPTSWEACRDRYGRIFYLDHRHRRTQWERPDMTSERDSDGDVTFNDDDESLVEGLALQKRPALLRQRRYNSVKGDRNYERVMRRYQSVRRVMIRNRAIEEENEPTPSVSALEGQPDEQSNDAPGPPSADPPISSSAAQDGNTSEPSTSEGTSSSDVTTGDATGVEVTSGDSPSTNEASQSGTERSSLLEQTPGFRFISHPEFVMYISTNEEAYNLYMNSSALRYMITKIHRDKHNFFEYQHNKELVKFINSFRDPTKPLPQGWEKKVDGKGSEFYVDHNLRQTTFFDPRLPFNDEETVASSATQLSVGEGQSERLPVQSPLPTDTPNVAPRPSSTLTSRSRAMDPPPVVTSPPPHLEMEMIPLSYNDKVVAFLKQPNIIDILKERYPPAASSQSLKDKVNSIRNDGMTALERYGNSMQLNIMLSLFENEISAFVVKPEPVATANVLAERPRSNVENLARAISPGTSPATSRSRGSPSNPLKRNFESKLRSFYRKLEQKGYGQGPGKIKLQVHRENLLEEAFRKVMSAQRKELQRSKLFISFIGEEGLDYSGPSREFFFLISRELFNPYYGLFEYSAVDTYTVQISPLSVFVDSPMEWFRFAGRIIGLSLIHHCLLDAFFTRPLYKMLLRSSYDLSDLRYVDEQFYQSMTWMKDNDITNVLDLTFSVDEEMFGKIEEKELKPNGKNIVVTEKNKKEYIERMVKWRVTRGTNEQTNMLIRGFNEVVDLRLLSVFDAHELELVLCGTADIDLNDWRQHTEYRGGYYDLHPVIQWFWLAVEQFDNERRLRLLQFVTGTSSIPYEGFAGLRGPNGPKRFCIEKWGKEDCLPRAHTCFNRIDVPPYRSFPLLWEKLVIAVEETSTFGME